MFALACGIVYLSFAFLAPTAFVLAACYAGWLFLVECALATNAVFRGSIPLERIRILPPPPEPPDQQTHEPAYRSYFFGPLFREYALAVEAAWQQGRQRIIGVARSPADQRSGRPRVALLQQIQNLRFRVPSRGMRLAGLGPYLGALVGVCAGFAFAAVFAAAVSVLYLFVLALAVLGSLIVAGVMRLFERLSLLIRGITLECRACHRRVTAPIYQCPRCPPAQPAMHQRLVPGSLGIFRRLCRCGQVLPTLLAGGKWKLPAYCNHCREALPNRAMTAPTFHIPVVAGRRAGKTVYMMSAIARMETRARREPTFDFEFTDEPGLAAFAQARAILRVGTLSSIPATDAARRVHAYTVFVRWTKTVRRRLLYFYDPSGEVPEGSRLGGGLAGFHFLGHTAGPVLVVDPFAFPTVRGAADPRLLTDVRPSLVDPEQVFGRFVQSLREHLKAPVDRRIAQPVAVVLTKADALTGLDDCAHPYEKLRTSGTSPADRAERSAAVRDWLTSTVGQLSLVTSIESSFSQVGYFAVSAMDAFDPQDHISTRTGATFRNDEPSEPVIWLLTAAGTRRPR